MNKLLEIVLIALACPLMLPMIEGEERKELDYMMNYGEVCAIFIKPVETEVSDEG